MARRLVTRLVLATALLSLIIPAGAAEARDKLCLVWVWIDGWRCAVGV